MKDYYYLLGIEKNASKEEIAKAFRSLSKKFHPDNNNGDSYFTEMFKKINEANSVLMNDHRRSEYDKKLNNHNQYSSSYQEEPNYSTADSNSQYPPHSSYNHRQNSEQKYYYKDAQGRSTVSVNNYKGIRTKAVKNLLRLFGLSILSYIVFDIILATASPVYHMPNKDVLDKLIPFLIVPIFYCGWKVVSYLRNTGKTADKIVITVKHQETLLEMLFNIGIKLFISMIIGFFAVQIYLILNLVGVMAPGFISRYKRIKNII